jgi:hypothetical protein
VVQGTRNGEQATKGGQKELVKRFKTERSKFVPIFKYLTIISSL